MRFYAVLQFLVYGNGIKYWSFAMFESSIGIGMNALMIRTCLVCYKLVLGLCNDACLYHVITDPAQFIVIPRGKESWVWFIF